MEKHLIYFSFVRQNLKFLAIAGFLVFHFSFVKAQDTIVFKTGEKLPVKVISAGEQVVCTTTQGGMQLSIDKNKVLYIKYGDGSRYTVEQAASLIKIVPNLNGTTHENDLTGQVIINIGAAYSPGFDGDLTIFGLFFPVGRNFGYFTCSSIIPNLNGIIDFGIDNNVSIGLAASYQSETVVPQEKIGTDKITRINLGFRTLHHLNKTSTKFDNYIGLRIGCSYWKDSPSYVSNNPYAPTAYFLSAPNSWVPSFQFIYGLCMYPSNYFGIHFDFGIGSPYLFEAGITFRINPPKAK